MYLYILGTCINIVFIFVCFVKFVLPNTAASAKSLFSSEQHGADVFSALKFLQIKHTRFVMLELQFSLCMYRVS